jgi:hypothetical protein
MSSLPGCFDWPAQYAGDTAPWQQFSLKLGGTPIDLTGATVSMQVRKRGNLPPIIDLSSSGGTGILITDAAGGVFRIGGFLNPNTNIVARYDIQVTFPSGDIRTFLSGSYEIHQQVTQ